MKKLTRIVAMVLAAVMAFTATVFAADVGTATIDTDRKTSLSVYKYDLTRAQADGKWDGSYVSTGIYDENVNKVLGDTSFDNHSATNNLAYGYAIKGVEFSYLKVADIATYSEQEGNGAYKVMVQYGLKQGTASNDLLKALNLKSTDAYRSDSGVDYFVSDTLSNALANALRTNATSTKNALERYMKANNAKPMPETDEYGHSQVNNLAQGLYLVVESRVPDMVTCTTNPFFVSLPMTTIDGAEWNYDVTVYPKNATGMPTLEKTVREANADTGKNDGSVTDITDGYAHTATASDGDVVDYQLISTLPTITSEASNLTCYTFVDTLSKGISYNGGDVVIEFFKDAACTDKITQWTEASGKFAVSYDKNVMTLSMTETGLSEINANTGVHGTDGTVRGYSDCTMRITYAATVNSDATVVYGDDGNPNHVQLTWKRTNTVHYDVLDDDCHVYTYGMDLLKQFSDGAGDVSKVQFKLHNDTDDYYVQAKLVDNVYYVTGHVSGKANATVFIPASNGHLVIKGLEDDAYTATEIHTDKGYVLLKDDIKIVIATAAGETCPVCHKAMLTAAATVNGDSVTMDGNHAIVPLTVVNNKGFELPKTGSYGTWMYPAMGVMLAGAAVALLLGGKKKKEEE